MTAARVPAFPLPRRPGQSPCLPRTNCRATWFDSCTEFSLAHWTPFDNDAVRRMVSAWHTRLDRCTTPTRTSWSRPTGSKAIWPPSTRARSRRSWAPPTPSTQAFDVDRIRRARQASDPDVSRRGRVADHAAQELPRDRLVHRGRPPAALDLPRLREPAGVRHLHEPARASHRRGRATLAFAAEVARGQRRAILDVVPARPATPACVRRTARRHGSRRSTGHEAIDEGAATLQIGQYCPPGHSPSHIDLDPLWASAAEAGVPVVLHVAGAGANVMNRPRSSRTVDRRFPTSTVATPTSSLSTISRSHSRSCRRSTRS